MTNQEILYNEQVEIDVAEIERLTRHYQRVVVARGVGILAAGVVLHWILYWITT